jgi:hypothetical protein
MLSTFLGWRSHGAGTQAEATAASPRPSPSMTGPAGVIRAALLSLALLGGWTGSGMAVTCSTSIPCKEIWFFNNSNETLHRGCGKTPTFNLRVESPSRFRQSENQ